MRNVYIMLRKKRTLGRSTCRQEDNINMDLRKRTAKVWNGLFRIASNGSLLMMHWQGPAAYLKDRPILSSERAPHRNKTVTVEEQ
jgi:hypothetical protein